MDSEVIGTKEMFMDQFGHIDSDKWCITFKNGSEKVFKHLYGGASDLAGAVDWAAVAIVDGDLQVGDI